MKNAGEQDILAGQIPKGPAVGESKRRGTGSRGITIRDVAKESGFSASTVSIVLNNAPLARYIPPHTKARIQHAAKSLGYHPNSFAKSLRSRRNHTVGVMLFDVTDPY
ncbi:MAG TPA: LacI family DNA-binding transcriptional regulator, partial [Terriglobales bacterium]|nr:LacI family DNA-binding transcriptional regulator [Terriglobales bacterium]